MKIKQITESKEEYLKFQQWNRATREKYLQKDGFLGIEANILPLVRAINFAGFYTTSSCEGHVTGRSVPFICFRTTDNRKQLFDVEIQIIKQTNNRWELHYMENVYDKKKSTYALQPITDEKDSIERLNQLLPVWQADILRISKIFNDLYSI